MSAIGIDLGTVNSCVAVWKRVKVDVIANIEGSRTTPSTVAFNDNERYVGDAAVNQITKNPTNTVYDVKRLIGRQFRDSVVQSDLKRWPFTVVNVAGKPKIQVEYRGKEETFAPEEISAMVLQKMKETAETYLGGPVKDAVISVPAYFSDAQRQATIDAGKIAGLNVLRIINEPTAAALAYGFETKQEGKRNILIYDLGGGTFDVSVVTIEEGPKFIVKATTGDSHLGGGDFDELLVNHLAYRFEKIQGINLLSLEGNKKPLCKLKIAAQKAKHILSSNFHTNADVDALVDGVDFSTSVSRARFEVMCSDLFKSTLKHVENALVDAKMKKSDIDDVVLVGGSTRIPKVQELLKEFFDGKLLKSTINPDEAVAYGAAIQAAVLSGEAGIGIEDISYNDLTSMSLGIKLWEGTMNIVIPRHSSIPCSKTENYRTSMNNQTFMDIEVYEGEERKAKDNNSLGRFIFEGIPPAPAEERSADITFDLNDNGILTVTAVEASTGHSMSTEIKMNQHHLSTDEIERMRVDTERFRADADNERQRVAVQHQLQSYAHNVVKGVDAAVDVSAEEKEVAKDLCNETLEWVDNNLLATTEILQHRLEELQLKCRTVMNKIPR